MREGLEYVCLKVETVLEWMIDMYEADVLGGYQERYM